MSETQQLKNLVLQLLSNDNNMRQQAENQLQQSASQNPDLFCSIALQMLQDSSVDNSAKMSTVIMLKKLYILGKNKPQLYLQMSNDARRSLRVGILVLLNNTEQKILADQISDFIADLAASLYNDNNSQLSQEDKWGDLVNHLFDLYKTNKVLSMVCSLRIFESILDQTDDKLSQFAPQFLELYQNGFQHSSIDVQFAIMKMLISMVLSFKPKDCKPFKPLIENVLKLVMQLLEQNNESYLQEAITKLFDLCTSQPYFIKRRFNDYIQIMSKVRDIPDQTDSNTKIESVESLVNVIERYPELANDQAVLKSIVELIFKNMLEIEDEVAEDWMSPPEGFNDDLIEDDDQKIIKIQMDSIDRLLNILTAQVMIPFLKNYLEQMFSQNNWKMSHAAVMTISQLGEYLDEDLKEIGVFMNILEQNAKHENPRLRYAVCQALGQFADDLSPDFQNDFHQQYFRIAIPLLNDPVPRVVAHCLASMTNFLENSTPVQIQPHFQTILGQIDNHLHNSISFVKEACLSTISALAEGSSDLFLPHYDQIMKLIFDILQNANKKEYKTLRGSAIECSTIIAKFFDRQKFQPYQDNLLKEMIRIQSNEVDCQDQDPQKQYLLSGWQRICFTLEKDLIPYLQQLMPSLLNMISKSVESIGKDAKGFRSSAHEEADIAIQLINIFLEFYGDQLTQYIPEIYRLINLINDNLINPETKITALSCLPLLLKISKNQNQEYKSFGTQTFGLLWDLFINEKDSSFKSEYCYLMQEILKKTGDIFNEQELQQFVSNVENELRKSNERKQNVLENIDEEEEDKKHIEFNIKCEHGIEDDFRLEVANLFGKVFQSHGQKSMTIFKHIYDNHIIPSFNDPSQLINLEYAIFLTDDSIEHLGQFMDQNTLQNFYQILTKFLLYEKTEIRQSASFGLGLLAQHLKQDLDSVYIDLMTKLKQMIEIPKQEQEQISTYRSSKENGIAAFAIVMQLQWNKMDQQAQYQSLKFFISNLPIIYDYKEGIKMHILLLQLCNSNWTMVLGNNNENVPQLVKIFCRIYQSDKLSNKELDQQIEMVMRKFTSDQNIQQVLNSMQPSEQQIAFIKKFSS